jgi:hypothetical protein
MTNRQGRSISGKSSKMTSCVCKCYNKNNNDVDATLRPQDATRAPFQQEWPHWLDRNYVVGAQSYPWILEDAYQNLSITELEIMQSAVQLQDKFCYFYFRRNDEADSLLDKVSSGWNH